MLDERISGEMNEDELLEVTGGNGREIIYTEKSTDKYTNICPACNSTRLVNAGTKKVCNVCYIKWTMPTK